MKTGQLSAAIAAMILAYSATAAPAAQADSTPAQNGEQTVAPEPGNFQVRSWNTVNGTSSRPEQFAAAAGPSKPVPLTFKNSYQGPANANGDKTMYAYFTANDASGAPFFLQSDGKPYYPPNPPAGKPAAVTNNAINIAIAGYGGSTTVNLGQYAVSARIYYSIGKLSFQVNNGANGAQIVGPDFTNPKDANAGNNYGFAELTFNSGSWYSDLSYVDYVGLNAQQTVTSSGAATCNVVGLPQEGTAEVCKAYSGVTNPKNLVASCQKDSKGNYLRVVSPEHLILEAGNTHIYDGYLVDYVNDVYSHYASTPLTIVGNDGKTYTGKASGSNLNFDGGAGAFAKPQTRDILGCNSGPFAPATGNAARSAVQPALCAAFVRGTLLIDGGNKQPNGVGESAYYGTGKSNGPVFHWGKYIHQYEIDGKGYTFAYDDVTPSGGKDQSGKCQTGTVTGATFNVGFSRASAS